MPCRVPVKVLPDLDPDRSCLRASLMAAPGTLRTLSTFRSLVYYQRNKARSSFARRYRTRLNNQRTKMDRSYFPNESDDNADSQALDEQPPGADQPAPALINPFSHILLADPPHPAKPQSDLTSIIRRPGGLPSSQVGQGVDTPRGSTTPLSAALSRAMAADAALHNRVDAPPPGSSYT